MKKIIAIVGFCGLFAAGVQTSLAGYFISDPISRCETQLTRTLQRGSENSEVYVLQQFLVNAGFLHAHPNGYFGYQTASAVRSFQYNNGIRVTGTVGEVTRNAINERLCDTDLLDNQYSYSYGSYAQTSGVTYVSSIDPYVNVQVINPPVTNPVVIPTPQSFGQTAVVSNAPVTTSFSSSAIVPSTVTVPSLSSQTHASQVVATGIVYNPSTGYTYGVIPRSGSLTVSSPLPNTVYQEGSTVQVVWTTDNLLTSPYSIILESAITGQSKTVAVVTGTSHSFVLTKELLDSVCAGTCNNNQQGSFRIVVSTPTTDIAGITSNLRAAIAPITVQRPFAAGKLSLTVSKTPVSSGEIFKLYVNAPTNSYQNYRDGSYTLRIKSTCPSSVSVSLAGASCGQEIVIPFNTARLEQGIPVTITNSTWYTQEVSFQIALVNASNQIVADTDAKVKVNSAPFSW